MAKKKSRKRGWSGAPAARPGGTTRPPGSATRPAGTATAPADSPELDDGPALGATKTAPVAPAKQVPAAPATSQSTSNRVARKEEARRQREIIRRKEARRRAFRRYGTIAGIAVVVIGLVVVLVVSNGAKGSKHPDPRSLPGINSDDAPWPPEVAHLSDRIAKMGLPPLGVEQVDYHIHQNLQVYVHGVLEPVPNGIGAISANELAEIHTHTNSGTIHVEAGATRHYTLGDVFDVWGVLFTPNQLGSYTNDAGDKIRAYVDGKQVTTDPTLIPLRDQEVIVVTYGTASEVPSPVPSVFCYDQTPLPKGQVCPPTAGGATTPPTSAPATSAPATSAPATSAPATSAPATSAPATSAPAPSGPTASGPSAT
jgi:hypothetical protein